MYQYTVDTTKMQNAKIRYPKHFANSYGKLPARYVVAPKRLAVSPALPAKAQSNERLLKAMIVLNIVSLVAMLMVK